MNEKEKRILKDLLTSKGARYFAGSNKCYEKPKLPYTKMVKNIIWLFRQVSSITTTEICDFTGLNKKSVSSRLYEILNTGTFTDFIISDIRNNERIFFPKIPDSLGDEHLYQVLIHAPPKVRYKKKKPELSFFDKIRDR